METFEINSLLRLLRTSLKSTSSSSSTSLGPCGGPVNSSSNSTVNFTSSSCVNFVNSGQRLEALKSLRRQLTQLTIASPSKSHRNFNGKTQQPQQQPLSSSLVHSILETLRQILIQLVSEYFGGYSKLLGPLGPSLGPTDVVYRQVNGTLKPVPIKPLTVDSVFAAAVRRNEILEIIQIVLQLIQQSKLTHNNKSTTISTQSDSQFHSHCLHQCRQTHPSAITTPTTTNNTPILYTNNNQNQHQIQSNPADSGRPFLPQVIALLGHESSDVQRHSIRFLLLYLSRTDNLQRLLQTFVRYGLESPNQSVQFGTLNSLPHLFIREEFRAENLRPLVQALGRLLLRSQSTNRHLFYPTYVSLERLSALLGIHRFYQYWTAGQTPDGATSTTTNTACSRSTSAAIALYENLQKRAPSPQIFINFGTGTTTAHTKSTQGGVGVRNRCDGGATDTIPNYKDNNNNNNNNNRDQENRNLGTKLSEQELQEQEEEEEFEYIPDLDPSLEDNNKEYQLELEDNEEENENFQEGDNDTVIDGARDSCCGGSTVTVIADCGVERGGGDSGGGSTGNKDCSNGYFVDTTTLCNSSFSVPIGNGSIAVTATNYNYNKQNQNQNNNYYHNYYYDKEEEAKDNNYYNNNNNANTSNSTTTTANVTVVNATTETNGSAHRYFHNATTTTTTAANATYNATHTTCITNQLNVNETNLNLKACRITNERTKPEKEEDTRYCCNCSNSKESNPLDSSRITARSTNITTTTTTTPTTKVPVPETSQYHHVTWSNSIVAIANSSNSASTGSSGGSSSNNSDNNYSVTSCVPTTKITAQLSSKSFNSSNSSSGSSNRSETTASKGPKDLVDQTSCSGGQAGTNRVNSRDKCLPSSSSFSSSSSAPPSTVATTKSDLLVEMAATAAPASVVAAAAAAGGYGPALAGYAQLDADQLANLDYIPTLKDYYPYLHSYGYDPLYPLAPNPLPTSVVAAAAAAHVPLYPHPHHHPLPLGAHPSIDRHQLLRFGIFPRVLIYQSLSSIAEEQFSSVQAIVRIVRDAPLEHLLLLIPHMDEFLTVFVSQLLLNSASNFKVILWTLDIVELLTERLQHRLHPFLSQIVLLLSRRLGDNRIVIRDSVIKVFHQMMHRYSPQEMVDLLFKHVSSSGQHTHSLAFTSAAKLREEMVNRITATVSTFPRNHLNLPKLCFDVVPFLVDRRSLVRLAALECVATLAQALGPHKLGSLMTAVHSLDSCLTPIDHDRLVAAIQARLARRSLPRTGPDGNVQYVLRVPNTGETQAWYYRRIYDADLEWIALGPTTPLPAGTTGMVQASVATAAAANLPLVDYDPIPATASSEESSNLEDQIAQQQSKMALDEERLARQDLIKSADSEDIPPPVKGQSVHLNHDPEVLQYKQSDAIKSQHTKCNGTTNNNNKKKPIDASSMAQDQPNQIRDFSNSQQQYEIEARARSLERSKTVQDYYTTATTNGLGPYYTRKQDAFLERLIRGESIDDSDLPDAQILRKSSVESLEAWRQYFGRFKKQLAEIALTGGGGCGGIGNRYGSRPGSGVFYGSPLPLPSYGLSPAYYYHYYCNGLSHSYHDLSQLQQQNMLSIMKRSGFMTSEELQDQTSSDANNDQSPQRTMSKGTKNLEPKDSKQDSKRRDSTIGNQSQQQQNQRKMSRSVAEQSNNKSKQQRRLSKQESTKSVTPTSGGAGVEQQPQSYNTPFDHSTESGMSGIERSLSMPAIGPGGLIDQMMMDNNGGGDGPGGSNDPDQAMISDEVIQELGMWEQVIQEEKKERHEDQEEEERGERSEHGGVSSGAEEADVEGPEYDEDQRANHRASMVTVPMVQVIQPTTPQSPTVRFEDESERDEHSDERSRREPSYEEQEEDADLQQQQSSDQEGDRGDAGNEEEDNSEECRPQLSQEKTSEEEEEGEEESEEQEEPEGPEEQQQPEEEKDCRRRSSTCDPSSTSSTKPCVKPSQAPPPGGAKPTTKPQTKSRIPAAAPAPARRLSRIPQQLYIKTTPAIPMNANIQHILTNVARTEGPFDYPLDAVKAALIAIHDNAWTTKVEGMLAVVRLATFHPNYLHRDQHQIALALVNETRNLRSTVSRSAIFTIGELFSKLKSQIEPEMDILIQALLYKVGENSIFIREDIDRALALMINSMPQTRAAISLITYGSNHRNTFVRRTSAQFLSALVEKMGAMKCLLGPRDIGEHLLPAAARFIQEGSPHTRYFGRRIFAVLMQHPLFEKLLRKNVSPGTYRNICGMLETIRRRGIGDRPADLYTPAVQPKEHDPRRLVVVGGGTDAK